MKFRMLTTHALTALTLATGLAIPGSAFAASGFVKGRVLYFENNGAYCDESAANSQNCTDTSYSFNNGLHTNLAMRSTKLYIEDQNDVIIGSGSTDSAGKYVIQWTSSTKPTALKGMVYPEHVSGIFQVMSKNAGHHWAMWWNTGKAPAAGAVDTAHAQDLGDKIFGSAASPNKLANVYGGATRMWASLDDSGLMTANYKDVEIRTFYDASDVTDTGPDNAFCPTACAFTGSNGQKYVLLADGHEFDQQARIMHEMGHIASQVANPRSLGGDYCFPDKFDKATNGCKDTNKDGVTAGNGHGGTTPEWYGLGFEEGLANFLANRGIYGQTATEPTFCSTNAACTASNPGNQMEFSHTGVACQTNEQRWEISTTRYLRDIYDNSNDSSACTAGDTSCQRANAGFSDPMKRPFDELLTAIWMFPAGFGDHEASESVDANFKTDKWDGFSPNDFDYIYKNGVWTLYDMSPQNTGVMRLANCDTGTGDTN